MRVVTMSVTMLVEDDTRPEKWMADTLDQMCLDESAGEKLLDITTISDEPQVAVD